MQLAVDSETIADTGFCHDVDGPGGIVLQLPPQVRDVHPQHVQLSSVSGAPDLTQQLLPREDLAPRADQGLQDVVFCRGKKCCCNYSIISLLDRLPVFSK
jgi:hypothetical protein